MSGRLRAASPFVPRDSRHHKLSFPPVTAQA